MAILKAGKKTTAHAQSRAQIVQKSREARGQVSILFSRALRDALRDIAAREGKTMVGLLDEISGRYVKRWRTKHGESPALRTKLGIRSVRS